MSAPRMKRSLAAAALLLGFAGLLAPAAGQFREDVKRKRATMAECQEHTCFGIDWRLAPLSEVVQLPSGLVTKSGETPLHYAIRYCAPPAVITALVEKGGDLNLVDPATGLPLLGNAILVCGRAVARRMLELGASALASEPSGGNMLHFALRSDRFQFLPLLLEYIANLDQADNNGLTPLQLALWKEDGRSAIMLLEAGADPDVQGSGGLALAHLAVYERDMNLLRALVDADADLGIVDDYGRSPLHYAASGLLDEEIASFFGNAGVAVNLLDDSGKAPIHYAALLADAESAAALLAIKADPNLPDLDGIPPLIHALRTNPDVRTVSALLRMGADPNMPAADGETPVKVAIAIRNDNALDELIAAGSRLRQVDDRGRTLLHFALEAANSIVADRLLAMGLDPKQEDDAGVTPLSLARQLQTIGRLGPGFAELIAAIDRQLEERLAAEEKAKQEQLDRERDNYFEAVRQANERRLENRQRQQQRERETRAKSVSPRMLASEIARRESALERLNTRLRNQAEGSAQAQKMQEQIARAQGELAKLREQLAGIESQRQQSSGN